MNCWRSGSGKLDSISCFSFPVWVFFKKILIISDLTFPQEKNTDVSKEDFLLALEVSQNVLHPASSIFRAFSPRLFSGFMTRTATIAWTRRRPHRSPLSSPSQSSPPNSTLGWSPSPGRSTQWTSTSERHTSYESFNVKLLLFWQWQSPNRDPHLTKYKLESWV